MNNQKGVFMMKEVTFEGIFAGLQILPSRDETEVKETSGNYRNNKLWLGAFSA